MFSFLPIPGNSNICYQVLFVHLNTWGPQNFLILKELINASANIETFILIKEGGRHLMPIWLISDNPRFIAMSCEGAQRHCTHESRFMAKYIQIQRLCLAREFYGENACSQ